MVAFCLSTILGPWIRKALFCVNGYGDSRDKDPKTRSKHTLLIPSYILMFMNKGNIPMNYFQCQVREKAGVSDQQVEGSQIYAH